MEILLHYVWKHRLYNRSALITRQGELVEVIDPGVHNTSGAGPDFFNAKLRIGGIVWAGNVELHERASDWFRHRHECDAAYNNVILHVVCDSDVQVVTADGKELAQLQLKIPAEVQQNYAELLAEESYPPCYRIIPGISMFEIHAWMNRLAVERLEQKTQRIQHYLDRTGGDWERAFFVALSRNMGFGVNSQAFEQWAFSIDPLAVGKHRDNAMQVEAFFMGQAGFLSDGFVPCEQQDNYFKQLQNEYRFLQHKFGLNPISAKQWKFGRLRPQNFPYVRISQLVTLFVNRNADFSRVLSAPDLKTLHSLFRVGVTPYWRNHYAFGEEAETSDKVLRIESLNLMVINTVAPLLFAYARQHMDEALAERAFELLESIPPESNHIIRCWQRAGLSVAHAADSQSLIQLQQNYCDRKDCLRCRFGAFYLRYKL